MKRPLVALALPLLALAACGDKKTDPAAASSTAEDERKAAELAAAIEAENNAPRPPKPPPKPSKFEATVDLTFTGAIEQKFEGPVGICGATYYEGKLQGGNYGIRTDDFEFQIMAMTDDELAKPGLLLNAKNPRRSFLGRGDGKNVQIDVDKGATVDAVLKDMESKDTIAVKGTISCGPDYRTR
jgi:hypothetical protein